MDSARMMLKCAGYSLRKMLVQPRLYMVLAFLLFNLENHSLSLYAFMRDYEVTVNAWGLFAIVLSSGYDAAMIGIGAVVLFSDAPFYDGMQQNILSRVGQKKWLIGQCIHVVVGTLAYMVLVFLLQVLLVTPYVEFGNDWGSALSTIVYTTTADEYSLTLTIPTILMEEFTPLGAFGLSVILRAGVLVICVLIMFIANTVFRSKFGAVIATFILLLDMTEFMPGAFRWLSISSFARLSVLDHGYGGAYPGLSWAACVIIVCLLISLGGVIATGRHFDVADLAKEK